MGKQIKMLALLLSVLFLVSCIDNTGDDIPNDETNASNEENDLLEGENNLTEIKKPDPVFTPVTKAHNVYRVFYPYVSDDGLPYRVYYPLDYDETYAYPLLLFLHGAGERGSDNEIQMKHVLQDLFNDTESPIYQSIVVVPQCPAGEQWVNTPWTDGSYDADAVGESDAMKKVLALVDDICENDSVNLDRIYVYGISMGGYGTWNLLMNHSDLFAAGVPICGGADPSKADILKDIPIYTFHGTVDLTVPFEGTKEVVEAILDAGGTKIRYEWGEGVDHGIWKDVAKRKDVIRWLFEQTRRTQ